MSSPQRIDLGTQHPSAYKALIALATEVADAATAAGVRPRAVGCEAGTVGHEPDANPPPQVGEEVNTMNAFNRVAIASRYRVADDSHRA